MLSHELRNPLAPLMNGVTLLKGWGPNPGAQTQARIAQVHEMMDRQVRQLARLIDDLLDISRIDRGKLELRRERVAADGIVRAAVEIARPNIESRRHELVLRFPGSPLYVEADPVRMAQVISNVLNNAAKFTPPGGQISITCGISRHGGMEFCVDDNGPGIPAEKLARIFQPFSQIDNRFDREAGGTGLGLALVQGLVQLHGGRAWLESEPGHGTRAYLYFPSTLEASPRQQIA
jgi:signal transduction histidine kinase